MFLLLTRYHCWLDNINHDYSLVMVQIVTMVNDG